MALKYLKTSDKLVLPRYVGGEYEGCYLLLELRLHLIRELFRNSALQETADRGPPVVILQNRCVLKHADIIAQNTEPRQVSFDVAYGCVTALRVV